MTAADPTVTDPDLLAEIAAELARMSPVERERVEADMAWLSWRRKARGWPDDLAEIVEGPYVPGDLKMHALGLPEPD